MKKHTVRVIRKDMKMPLGYVDAWNSDLDDNNPGPYWHEDDQIALFIIKSLDQLDDDPEAHSWEFKQKDGDNFIFQGVLYQNVKKRSRPGYAI